MTSTVACNMRSYRIRIVPRLFVCTATLGIAMAVPALGAIKPEVLGIYADIAAAANADSAIAARRLQGGAMGDGWRRAPRRDARRACGYPGQSDRYGQPQLW